MKKILIVILVLISLTGCSKNEDIEVEEPEIEVTINETLKFKEEYEQLNSSIEVTIPENVSIHYANSKEVYNILENKTGVIYFGRPSCMWCRNAISVLLEVIEENNLTLNYLNPDEVPSDDMEYYVKIKEKISDYLRENEYGQKTLYIPDVYFVKNGKVVGHHLSTVQSQREPYPPLVDYQKNELKAIYNNYINLMNQ